MNSIERIQKFALRLCSKTWDSSYQELLQLLSLTDLQQRRLYLDLSTMFRVVHGPFHFPNNVFVHQRALRRLGHQIIIFTFVLLPVHSLISIHLCLVLFVIGTPYPPLLLIFLLHVAFGHTFISTLLFLCPLYIHMHIYKTCDRKKNKKTRYAASIG